VLSTRRTPTATRRGHGTRTIARDALQLRWQHRRVTYGVSIPTRSNTRCRHTRADICGP